MNQKLIDLECKLLQATNNLAHAKRTAATFQFRSQLHKTAEGVASAHRDRRYWELEARSAQILVNILNLDIEVTKLEGE